MADFEGYPVESIGNEFLRLDYLKHAGPRLVRLVLNGSDENLFAPVPASKAVPTPYGEYLFIGGHRLWHAPEANPRTYIPDAEGLAVETTAEGVRLTGAVEPGAGIQKQIEVRLLDGRPGMTLTHTLTNAGLWPVELAPWAITQLTLGGMAIFPQQTAVLDADGLLPNRNLVLWPYTRWDDGRLETAGDLLLIHARPQLPPLKVGYLGRQGWLGYLRKGVFFCKRFTPQPAQPHVDFGCNTESYINNLFIELETLGPLARLEPGQSVVHTEEWEITTGLDYPETLEGARRLMAELGLPVLPVSA